MIKNLAVNHNFIGLGFTQNGIKTVTHFCLITNQRHAQRLLYAVLF